MGPGWSHRRRRYSHDELLHGAILRRTSLCQHREYLPGKRLPRPETEAAFSATPPRSPAQSRFPGAVGIVFDFRKATAERAHRSISPNTISSEPIIAETSASMCPRLKKSIACRWANEGARILHL